MSAPLGIRQLPGDEIAAAGEIWRALEARNGHGALTCSWDWTESWLGAYADAVPHRFVVAERDGTPRAVALVTDGVRRRGPFKVRTAHLGTAGEPPGEGIFVEYNRLLASPEEREAFARELVRVIGADRRWDEFRLDGFAAEDGELLMGAEPALAGGRAPCPTTDLRAANGEVLGLLRSGARARVRRSLRGLGPVSCEWAESPAQAADILAELVELHQRRWTALGKPGAFASMRAAAFHRDLIRRLLPHGRVMLFRATTAEGTVGCLYGFIERDRVLYYQGGMASFDDPRLKPGLVTHAQCMQACAERGLAEYDFLAGDSRYKRELSNTERWLVWASARRRRPKLVLANAAKRVVRGSGLSDAPFNAGR